MGHHSLSRRTQRGITLIEVLMTLAIAAVLAAVAVPGFSNVLRNQRLDVSAMRFLTHLQLARQTAIMKGTRVTMRAAGAKAWEHGWTIFTDRDGDGVLDADEGVIARGDPLPPDTILRGNATVSQWLSFTPDGYPTLLNGGFQAGSFRVCNRGTGLALVMSRTGRVRTDRSAQAEAACA